MKLSLSVRIAEASCKTKLNVPFGDLVQLAAELGYGAICMRASAGGIGTPHSELQRMRGEIERAGLYVSMVTADSDVPLNNEHGPDSLKNIGPSLDVAAALGCDLIRVCLKNEADIETARRTGGRGGTTRDSAGSSVSHDDLIRVSGSDAGGSGPNWSVEFRTHL